MSAVLVTGGTGFIGSNLIPHLLRGGAHVRTLVRDAGSGLLDPGTVEMIVGDVCDPDAVARAMKGADTVYHVAGLVSYWRARRRELYEVNVAGTRNIVSACLAEGVRRLIFTSSVGAVGVPAEGSPGNEATPYNWDPCGYHYCLTKYLAEGEVYRGVAAGLSAVILNPALVAGPRDVNWNAGRIFAMVNRSNRVMCTNGTVSLVDVDDVCRAHIAAASSGKSGARYILAGHSIAYRDLFAEVASVMGRSDVKVKVVSDRTALLAARTKTAAAAVTRREPDITPELVRMNVRWRVFDASAAKRDLGFTVTPLRETLQRTYGWYRANNLLLPEDGRPTMDMRRMHYFLTLAERRHFGRAADCLGISQPALSQQVRRLEEEFSAVLIERGNRTIALTAAGAAIVAPVRKCLAAYDEAVLAAHKAGEQTAARLRIGFPGAEVGWALLPSLLRRISERLPEARLEVVEASCSQQAADLKDERIDAGFMHLPVADEGLAALRVRQDELVILLPRNHPSAAPEHVSLDCLADEPFIDFRVHCTAYSQALSSLIHRSGISPRIEYGSTGLATTLEMVASRLGVAIVLGSAVHQAHEQVVVRRLLPSGKGLDIAFVWRPSNNSAELRKVRHLIGGLGEPVPAPDARPGQGGSPVSSARGR